MAPWIPRFRRNPLEATVALCDPVDLKPLVQTDRSCSNISFCSTDTSDDAESAITSEDDSIIPSRSAIAVQAKVHFSRKIEEVFEVSQCSIDEIVGCSTDGTRWCVLASRRAFRFGLKVHNEIKCSKRKTCCCDSSGELCTRGGVLASEIAIGLADIFTAWRKHIGVPATVPWQVQSSGMNWPRKNV